ncbi:MAG TPA: 2OG-Fe(II) oxygenase [Elusimicrobiota bacterium]|nr:2OG-Fe(II) oxygenase [Elusimicrobiota bacterium]
MPTASLADRARRRCAWVPPGDAHPAPACVGFPGVAVTAEDSALERMRREFEEKHFVAWRGLIEPGLLDFLMKKVASQTFGPAATAENPDYVRVDGPVSLEINEAISVFFRDPKLYRVVRAITDAPPIETFGGRVIRLCPGKNHYIRWHCDKDTGPERAASLRLNLSPRPWRGGVIEFKRSLESPIHARQPADACGDVILFRSADGFHRNTKVAGSEPKITFSGWFYAQAPR